MLPTAPVVVVVDVVFEDDAVLLVTFKKKVEGGRAHGAFRVYGYADDILIHSYAIITF